MREGLGRKLLVVVLRRKALVRHMRLAGVVRRSLVAAAVVLRSLDEVEAGRRIHREEEQENRNLVAEEVDRSLAWEEERHNLGVVAVDHTAGKGCAMVEERHIDRVAGNLEEAVVDRTGREEVL